jgi:hypothetical protein
MAAAAVFRIIAFSSVLKVIGAAACCSDESLAVMNPQKYRMIL